MKSSRTAFSLIELLVVIAILGILSVMTITAMSGVTSGRNLQMACNMVLDQISLARQSALSKNARVRLQIISIADGRNNDPPAFRRMQLEIFDPTSRAWNTLTRSVTLPIRVVADPGRSTLLTNSASGATNAVMFLASGRTRLNPNDVYSLTLFDARNTNNYITVQLDPVSGRCRTFQP